MADPFKDGTWHNHFVLIPRQTVDGTWCWGNVKRRWLHAHDYVFNSDASHWVYSGKVYDV